MVFDSAPILDKIKTINDKIMELDYKQHELSQLRERLSKIIDVKTPNRQPNGQPIVDEQGDQVFTISAPKDDLTGETLSDERRETIKTSLFSKADELLSS